MVYSTRMKWRKGAKKYERKMSKYSTKPRTWVQSIGDYASTAEKALSIATKVASLINVEKKNIQYTHASNQVGTSGLYDDLTYIAEGSDVNQRTGQSVKCMSVNYNLQFDAIPSSAQTMQGIRFVIFKWNDDTAPVGSMILDTYQNGSTLNYLEPLNKSQIGKFSILHDEIIKLNPVAATTNHSIISQGHIKLDFHTKYSSGGAATGSVGRVFAMLVSNDNSTPPLVTGFFRVNFVDN